ncbi:MAG: 50S ribosomal protein L15 [Patescibacteria group bacterium]
MQLNDLKRKNPNRAHKRVGRGGARGKTSGRGTKGQKARAGHRIMPAIREILKKIPKRRGYSFQSIQAKPAVLNLSTLEKFFSVGDAVNPVTLRERGIVRGRRGASVNIKILGDGELTKKLVVTGVSVSASAKQKIEKAGGTIAAK